MQDVESRNAGVQEFRIALGKRRIRRGEAERGARHQDKAARRFGFDEALERGSCAAR